MIVVEVLKASTGQSFYKKFRDYNELITWMRNHYDRWIVDFKPLLSKAQMRVTIYDDFIE